MISAEKRKPMPEGKSQRDQDEGASAALPGLEKLLSLSEAAERTDISASHLRLLVRNQKVWGTKLGRNWVTTEEAVKQYLAQEHKPGRKPKERADQS